MKLEAGMFVRSKINGMISKITDIEQFEELGQIVERYILDNNYNVGFCSTEKDSVIASHNIIDLIEVGDYINGKQVINKWEEPDWYGYFIRLDGEETIPTIRKIETIVTKEQFESMQYEVK